MSETVVHHALWFDALSPRAAAGDDGAFLRVCDEVGLSYTELNYPAVPRPDDAPSWTDVVYQPLVIGLCHAGAWRRTVESRVVRLEIVLYRQLTADEHAALDEAVSHFERPMANSVVRCSRWLKPFKPVGAEF